MDPEEKRRAPHVNGDEYEKRLRVAREWMNSII